MNPKRLLLALAGMLCLVFALGLFTQMMTVDKTTAAKPGDSTRCPNCNRVLPKGSFGECPYCKLTRGPQDAKKAAKEKKETWTTTEYLALGCIGFLVIGGGFLLSRSLKGKFRFSKPQADFLIRCGRCRRRVRYFGHQAGKRVLCPGCMWCIELPPLSRSQPSPSP